MRPPDSQAGTAPAGAVQWAAVPAAKMALATQEAAVEAQARVVARVGALTEATMGVVVKVAAKVVVKLVVGSGDATVVGALVAQPVE